MSAWAPWVIAVGLGLVVGEVWFKVRIANEFLRGVTAGRSSSELEHGWHQPMHVGVNPVDVPANRHRSPDDQLVTRTGVPSQPRPGFHDLPS